MGVRAAWVALAAVWATGVLRAAELPALCPVVEVEEDVYSYTSANNGSGPTWCSGSTCLARVGDAVVASGLETLRDVKPMNNCRWTLYERTADGWRLRQADPNGRTREPCPLVTVDGSVLLSVNPTLVADRNAYSGPARPEILRFAAQDLRAPFQTWLPMWSGQPAFTEHSYRSFVADGAAGTLAIFQNIGETSAVWALHERQAGWTARGSLAWPWGADYPKPQPIRVCYPNVALRGRAVHFCGVSDIIEPNPQWREFKRRLTGQNWDYDFRRLYYTWSKDLATGRFEPWVEIASREKTCGWIDPGDLWLGPDETVHVLWTERALDERLRAQFFPNEKQSRTLHYAVLRDGKVLRRAALLRAEEGGANQVPGRGRFHVTPDGRLWAFYFVSGTDNAGKAVCENRLVELTSQGPGTPVRVPLKHSLNDYFTATVRAGSGPSVLLDLFGHRAHGQPTMSYARVRLWPQR